MVLDLFFPPLPLPFGPQFGPKTRGSPGPQGPSPGSATACSIQLFRERLSEKNVHATIPKGNMGYDQYTVPDDCSCRIYLSVLSFSTRKHMSMASSAILSNFFEEK